MASKERKIMQDFINFLTNLRNSQREVGQKANKAASEMTNYVVNGVSDAANRGFNTAIAPFVYAGNEVGNTINSVGQSAGQAFSNLANGLGQGAYNIGNAVNNAFGIGDNRQAQTTPVATLDGSGVAPVSQATQQMQAPVTAGRTYQRDSGIDTFVSALRYFMNPIRGITGETPLDILANQISDSMYTSFGKQVQAPKTTTEDAASAKTDSTASATTAKESTGTTPTETESDVVTYTYKPGDTFGQVLLDLGLNTGNGLWGSGGDVEYYTRQLINQGALDRNGNIPIGTTIRLTRRK